MDKCPKRRKDKYNPYTLCSEKGRYYISFVDVNNNFQEIADRRKCLRVSINLNLKIFHK